MCQLFRVSLPYGTAQRPYRAVYCAWLWFFALLLPGAFQMIPAQSLSGRWMTFPIPQLGIGCFADGVQAGGPRALAGADVSLPHTNMSSSADSIEGRQDGSKYSKAPI